MKGLLKRYTDEEIKEALQDEDMAIARYGETKDLTDSQGVATIWTWRAKQADIDYTYTTQAVRKRVYDKSFENVPYEARAQKQPPMRFRIVDAFFVPLYPEKEKIDKTHHPRKKPRVSKQQENSIP